MRDVAALARVSIKTVSRVVNQEPGVSPELADRVLDAVGLLGYRHNLTASSLRRADQKTATIGLLLEDISNPFSSALHRAIEDVARRRGTLVLAGSSDEDPDRQQELLYALVSRRVDGLIAMPASGNQSGLLRERRLGRPMVLVDRPAPEADSVVVDNRAGVGLAVRQLAAHGHRRIAFLGDLRSIWTATERHAGYVEALAAQGIMLNPRLVRMDVRGVDVVGRIVHELLAAADPPTALLAGQNLITIGAVHALQQLGLQHRVALLGFDDFPLAELLNPGVSVIAQDPTGLGQAAAELLFARIDGDRAPPRQVVVPTRLVPRGSGEIPAP
ncbi:MAG TPA: LacI family DNA-binding transcriptional regulator [Asanoa sp.]|jgi:LacI family transcriptional regulator